MGINGRVWVKEAERTECNHVSERRAIETLNVFFVSQYKSVFKS